MHTEYPWLKSYDEGVDWFMEIPVRPVFAMLDDTAKLYGDRPAFDFLGKKYNWREIFDLANRFAAGLQKQGIGKGYKVGLFLPNCPYYLIAYYGILKAGATVVNFNPLYAERELKHQIEDSETDFMVTTDLTLLHDKMLVMLAETRLQKMIVGRFTDILPWPQNILFPIFKRKDHAKIRPSQSLLWFHDLINNDGNVKSPTIDAANDIAVLQYTGGTTGTPKGAMLTHYNVYANTLQSVSWIPALKRGHEKTLGVLPFFHVFAMTAVMNFSVMAGFEIFPGRAGDL